MLVNLRDIVLRGGIAPDSRLPIVVGLAVVIALVAGVWRTFRKAKQPGWAALVPFYNFYVMLEIGNTERWWLLVLFVPVANVYAAYRMVDGVASAFGRGTGFALGLLLVGFVFWPLLGFGEYSYQGSTDDVLDDRLEEALEDSDDGVF